MKIKMKKIISIVLVLLILLSNSPISLAMGKDSFDEHTKEISSIVTTNTQEIKEDSPDEKRKSESKSNSLEIKNSEDLTKGSIINSFETSKKLPKTYFYENGEIEISIELKQGTLQEEAQLIVKEVDSEKDDRQLGLQKRITNMITEKLNEKQKLNKAKIYDIYFINKDGDRIHDLEILNIHYVFKKPFSLEEQNELSIFSLFNNELIDCKDTEIKRNDRNEIVELSFEVDKIEQLILIDTVEKNINPKEESQEVHEEELKEEQEDKRTDKLKEFTLNYSDYEKKLISKFEKLVKDKSGESRLTHQDTLELKDKFDIKDYDENSPEYIDIFAETNHADGLIPRSYNRQPDIFQMDKVPNLQKQKTIDYLGDGVKNPDTNIQKNKTSEEIADNYRIYLDVSSETQAEKNGIDLVVVVDRSGSMKRSDMTIGNMRNQPRYKAIDYFLNGSNGFISKFLNQNPKNNISVVDFGGIPSGNGINDASLLQNWTNNVLYIPIKEPGNEGTNYDAGFKIAEEQFSKKTNSENSKVMLFLSDGVPTYYIDSNGRRQGDGRIYNTDRFYDNQNVVRRQMLNYNVPDFYRRNPDITTIAVGVSRDINSTNVGSSMSPDVLRKMAELSGGVFLGIEENIDELTSQLANEVLYAVSQVTVTDILSEYVKLDSTPDFKVTVTDTNGQIKTLWKDGKQTPENENGKYIKSVESETVEGEERVILTFNPNYKLDKNLKFSLSYNVTVPRETFEKYQEIGYLDTGDSNTDYPRNSTSSGKKGFHSNKEAYVDFAFGPEEKKYTEFYDHPVVQVALQNLSVKKVDSVGNPLENAKFAIYKENPDENQNVQPLELYDNEALSVDKKTEFITNDKGEIKIYGLVHGTYYLKEIEAPEGFSEIENSLKIEVSRLGKVSMKADDNFSLNDNTVIVKNELTGGYELPTTGGSGNTIFRLIGLLVLAIALIIPYRKRQIKCER